MLTASESFKIASALDYATGTADRNGIEIDMTGYRSVLIIVKFAAIAAGAVTTIKAQRDIVTGMATAADILGSAQTVADDDDNTIKYIDIIDPGEQFVRLVVDKDASNATAESAVAILYNARKTAVTQPSGTVGERLSAVVEGTA